MNTPISDKEALLRIAALSADADAAGQAVADTGATLDDAKRRQSDMRQLLADHANEEPTADLAAAAELSSALAANPAAAASADWTGKLRESQDRHDAELVAWKGKWTVLEQAAAQIEEEITSLRAAADRAKAVHESAWRNFVGSAYNVMLDELIGRFPAFYAEVLGPLEALDFATHIYSNQQLSFGARRSIGGDCKVYINRPTSAENPMPALERRLYPIDDVSSRASSLDAFRAALRAHTKPANGAGPKRAARSDQPA